MKFVVRCSKDRGEGGSGWCRGGEGLSPVVRCNGFVVRCSKDCGEVVNNWLVNAPSNRPPRRTNMKLIERVLIKEIR